MKKYYPLIIGVLIWAVLACGAWFGLQYYDATFTTIDGIRYRRDTTSLDLSGGPVEQLEKLQDFYDLKALNMNSTGLTPEQYDELKTWLPDTDIQWQVLFQRSYLDSEIEELSLTSLTERDITTLDNFSKLSYVNALACEDYPQLVALRARRPGILLIYDVNIGGKDWPYNTRRMELTDADPDELEQLLAYLPELEIITLRGELPDIHRIRDLMELYPEVSITWKVDIGDLSVESDVEELDLTGIKLGSGEAVEALLPYLTDLKQLTLCNCGIPQEDMLALLENHPEICFIWDVSIGYRSFRCDVAEIDLSYVKLNDVSEIEDLLYCFPNLTWVDMSHCGISNEEMDALNNRYADIRFVWTVRVGSLNVRTDEVYFMPSKYGRSVTTDDVYNLRYCTDMLCVDLGHNEVENCDFVAYMPHLKYLLLADTKISSIEPVAGLQELIYVEIFMTNVKDYSPLLQCPALEDLNICYTFGDPEPILQMTWLKRLWWSTGGHKHLTAEQKEMIREALPDAQIDFTALGSTDNGWRQHQNYYDMRDLIGMYYMD